MTTINSTGNVSSLMQSQSLLADLDQTQAQMQKVEQQISTGNIISQASDNPLIAGQLMSLNSLLDQIGQFKSNADSATNVLTAADTALGSASALLQQASSLASSAANTTTTDSQRSADAEQLGTIIAQMTQLANTQYDGQYLFDGQDGGQSAPFVSVAGGVQYTGSASPTSWQVGKGWTMQADLSGSTVFGGESAAVDNGLQAPVLLDLTTPLSDLGGVTGNGLNLGVISVSDGVHAAKQIDLSHASTLGDLIAQFNAAAPPGTTLSLDMNSRQVDVTTTQAGGKLTISDVAGDTASGLGIIANGSAAWVSGQDIQRRLSATTPLAALTGLDLSGGMLITNGSASATISLNGMTRVQDLLNAVNSSGAGVQLSIAPYGKSLQLTNLVSGSNLSVSNATGTVATQLGLRTFTATTPLASLNGGAGVTVAGNGQDDFCATLHDGTTVNVSLDGCKTVGDVVAAINDSPDNLGALQATINSMGGIQLIDDSSGSSDFSVAAVNGSSAAAGLGLVGDTTATTITGTDTSAVGTGGVFEHLLALQQALQTNDQAGITTQGGLLNTDAANLATVQGVVGAQAAAASNQSGNLAGQSTATQTLISQANDVDLTSAITQFEQLQMQLDASMSTMGKILSTNLMNYLPTT